MPPTAFAALPIPKPKTLPPAISSIPQQNKKCSRFSPAQHPLRNKKGTKKIFAPFTESNFCRVVIVTPSRTAAPQHYPLQSTPRSSLQKQPRHLLLPTACHSASPAPSPPEYKHAAQAATHASPCHPYPESSRTEHYPAESSPNRPHHPAKPPAAAWLSSPPR